MRRKFIAAVTSGVLALTVMAALPTHAEAVSIWLDRTPGTESVETFQYKDYADRYSDAYELYGYEVLHTTQAMNMRMQDGKKVGEGTTKFLNAYRKTVSFVTKDRIYTNDIKFLRTLDPATLK